MMPRFIALVMAVVLLGAATPMPYHTFLRFRDEALGAWIPRYPADWSSDPRASRAPRAVARDRIAYRTTRDTGFGLGGAPADGRFFWHGDAGPPKGRVVIDPRHRIAFAGEGCCSWYQETLARYRTPPPKRAIPQRDLAAVGTVLGVRLGMTPAQVRLRVGAAPLRRVGKTALQELSYFIPQPPSPPPLHNDCGEELHYVFRSGTLDLISFTDGC